MENGRQVVPHGLLHVLRLRVGAAPQERDARGGARELPGRAHLAVEEQVAVVVVEARGVLHERVVGGETRRRGVLEQELVDGRLLSPRDAARELHRELVGVLLLPFRRLHAVRVHAPPLVPRRQVVDRGEGAENDHRAVVHGLERGHQLVPDAEALGAGMHEDERLEKLKVRLALLLGPRVAL